jgi:hypothetical protein
MHSQLFAPLLALVLWTFVMCAWLYATRIPAISRLKIVFDQTKPSADFHAQLPPQVRWKADNYNNLLEQPTLFYAVVVTLALLGADGPLNLALAWAYVGVRVVHSFIQATVNIVLLRFSAFMLGTLILLGLTIRACWLVF